ncbi:MAG: helix-turn-helix domain-containing protein [Burkholderiales bacterium]|nr:helix-turn-helix domain-containing protein [Burkholderiales bacterium]
MLTSDAIAFFGGAAKLADAIGVRAPSIYSWGERVPWRRQIQLEQLSRGALKHCPDDIPIDIRHLMPSRKPLHSSTPCPPAGAKVRGHPD